jgi:putative hydrolase of the HAD superfamily
MPISYLLFDAANTLIHKPLLWERLDGVLRTAGYEVPPALLRRNHKLLSEWQHFPDRTSGEFYRRFNGDLLYSLGISPTDDLLDAVFKACTYLPWEPFADTAVLRTLPYPIGIVSNFNNGLTELAHRLFGADVFRHIVISEVEGVAKPEARFYEAALRTVGVAPEEILYIGDSIRLDMEPAARLGLQTALIDRDGTYPVFPRRLDSLADLPALIARLS